MLNSKQRAKLKAISASLSPITQIGKGGISENLITSLSEALEAREIIKLNVLTNSDDDARELARELEKALKAECVQVIGRKIVLYRVSKRDNFAHIEID